MSDSKLAGGRPRWLLPTAVFVVLAALAAWSGALLLGPQGGADPALLQARARMFVLAATGLGLHAVFIGIRVQADRAGRLLLLMVAALSAATIHTLQADLQAAEQARRTAVAARSEANTEAAVEAVDDALQRLPVQTQALAGLLTIGKPHLGAVRAEAEDWRRLVGDRSRRAAEDRAAAEYAAEGPADGPADDSVRDGSDLLPPLGSAEARLEAVLCGRLRQEGPAPVLNQVGWGLAGSVTPDGHPLGPYCRWQGGQAVLTDLSEVPDYDYLDPAREDGAWFRRARDEGAGWSAPYYDPPTGAMLAEHTQPLHVDGSFVGVAFANYSLQAVTSTIKGLDLGPGGWAFVTTPTGKLVAWPNRADIEAGLTLAEVAERHDDDGLRSLARTRFEGRTTPLQIEDFITGEPAAAWCANLSSSGWRMCTVTVPVEVGITAHSERQVLLAMTMAAVVGLIALLALLVDARSRRPRRLWAFSLGSAGVFALAIAVSWQLEWHQVGSRIDEPLLIADHQLSEQAEGLQAALDRTRAGQLVLVRTGLVVEDVTFHDDGQVLLSGLLWQKEPVEEDRSGPLRAHHDAPDAGADPDVTLRGVADVDFSPAYHQDVGRFHVSGWRFQATVPRARHGERFPIDHTVIRLRLTPEKLGDPVLLVPDLAAYDAILPSARPGVAPDLDLAGWQVRETGFQFTHQELGADLGLGQVQLVRELPDLTYEITLRRKLLDPSITWLLPVVILYFLMFSVQLIISDHSEATERFGFDANSAIGAFGTFFFIAVLEHIALREALGVPKLAYFEWFFIVTYASLLAQSLDALLVASRVEWPLIRDHDNLWPKLMFWPVNTGVLLVLTIWSFY